MTMRGNRVVRAVSVAGVVAMAASSFAVSPASAGKSTSLHGVFNETALGSDAGYDIHGSVKMTIGPAGTVVKVNVSGLDPERSTAHICTTGHARPVVGATTRTS